MSKSGNERVLAALRKHPKGITPNDFLYPYVMDGGDPITRLAARIKDLRDQGVQIENVGTQKRAVYRLVSVPVGMRVDPVVGPLEPPADQDDLPVVGVAPRNAIYGWDE